MYFLNEPKSSPSDFFNYRLELERFRENIGSRLTKMVVVRGLRRTGKTSFVRVGLSGCARPWVSLDVRALEDRTRSGFALALARALSEKMSAGGRIARKVKEVTVGPVKFGFDEKPDLWPLLKAKPWVLFIDEAQLLAGTGADLLLAAIYDDTECFIVLSGSEAGLLDDFVGVGNPKRALFGRVFRDFTMPRLTSDRSLEFLRLGFAQAKHPVSDAVLQQAVGELDGVIGYLTMYGNHALSVPHEQALELTKREAVALIRQEFENLLANRGPARVRYLEVMRAVCRGNRSFTSILSWLSSSLAKRPTNASLSGYLSTLVDHAFLEKTVDGYLPADPLVALAFQS